MGAFFRECYDHGGGGDGGKACPRGIQPLWVAGQMGGSCGYDHVRDHGVACAQRMACWSSELWPVTRVHGVAFARSGMALPKFETQLPPAAQEAQPGKLFSTC